MSNVELAMRYLEQKAIDTRTTEGKKMVKACAGFGFKMIEYYDVRAILSMIETKTLRKFIKEHNKVCPDKNVI